MEIMAKVQINNLEIDTISRQTARLKAAFLIGNMPNGMNPFSCSVQLNEKAKEHLDGLITELIKSVGDKINEKI